MDWMKRNVHPRIALQCTCFEIVKITLYSTSILLGLITSISLGKLKYHAAGNCLLSSRVNWSPQNVTGAYPFTISAYAPTACNFVIYYNVIVEVFLPITLLVYITYRVYRGKLQQATMSALDADQLLICALLATSLVLCLACAITVTAGLAAFCYTLTAARGDYRDTMCSDVTLDDAVYDDDGVQWDLSNFFDITLTARTTSWISLFVKLGILAQILYAVLMEKRYGTPEERLRIAQGQPSA